ncbi:hypothetical protein C1708_03715 [Streptomyces sp. DH-12]|uniref:hypothetical protein n=1 Tax=unclassified Streptomyces TaxID=2593676 RepID=UPI000CCEAC54|nr:MULTISPECIES: hypothetical protein [unclassified Streptomyces]MDN3270807.1 hypothetical protein [Streptomyces sp. MA15]PNV31520.1 hypothetical protein C1708_03715 [Streptomyces sp. DH-12]
MIDESHVRDLCDAANDDAALVLLEGRARVVDQPSGEESRGALLVITKRDLVERLGPDPSDQALHDVAGTLTDTVGKLGA